jgi:hypothetical protein
MSRANGREVALANSRGEDSPAERERTTGKKKLRNGLIIANLISGESVGLG